MRQRSFPLAIAFAFALGTGCGAQKHHLYPGPERAPLDLARVECYRKGTTVELRAVDDQPCPPNYVYLTPGRHRLRLAGPLNITATDAPPDQLRADPESERPLVALELEAVAGMHYFLGATYKELAFLRNRSDQTRVWDEGFYKTWTLDLYGQPQGALGLAPLIKSYPQKAE
ncbi:hypothetical protein FJ251_16325 [bacterium]|nr:hypothetical protein [bacterium]